MSTPLISRKKRNVWGAVSIALAVVAIVLAVLFFNSRAALGNTDAFCFWQNVLKASAMKGTKTT